MAAIAASRPTRSRLRARRACIPCRVRKRKCDANFPCAMCEAYGYECQFAADDGPAAALLSPHPAATRSSKTPPQKTGHPAQRRSADVRRTAADQGILDSARSRFVGQSSVIAFPRSLDQSFGSQQPLALHSFGWNLGTRPEEMSEDIESLVTLISRHDLDVCSSTFFSVLGPIFDIIDQRSFSSRCLAFYSKGHGDYAFGAVIAGVVALGSLFGNKPHARELEIVRSAKRILEDPISTRRPSVDQIVGWILRTLYLRATTRPNNAWIASSTMMHLVEATGLHHDPTSVQQTSSDPNDSEVDLNVRRRVFWCAWSLNKIISYEYSRTAITIPNITCKPVSRVVGSFMLDFVSIVETIPDPHAEQDSPDTLMDALHQLAEIFPGHPMLQMTKADVAFCFFRRLRHLGLSMPSDIVEILLNIGNRVLESAAEMNHGARPWWNILGTVFQYTCVLLALDTPASLARISGSVSVLKTIANVVDTHLAREAFATAQVLVKAALAKKKKEASFLEQTLNDTSEATTHNDAILDNETFTPAEMVQLGINLDGFLNDPFPFTFTDDDLNAQNMLSYT